MLVKGNKILINPIIFPLEILALLKFFQKKISQNIIKRLDFLGIDKPGLFCLILVFSIVSLFPDNTYSQTVDSIYTNSGSFTVPEGVTSIKMEAWGAGGNGAPGGKNNGGGGGGGGAYVGHPNYGTSAFTIYTINIGTINGDSTTTINTNLFLAGGGADGSGTSGGSGGSTVTVPAGGSSNTGGGGSNNNVKDGGDGGTAGGSGGGVGGLGGTDGKGGAAAGGGAPPGGGGGGGAKNEAGGGGAAGQVIISWTCDLGAVTTSGSTDICSGTVPTGISTGGAEGSSSFTYQWYSQAGSVTPTSGSTVGWTLISGQTGKSLTASAITVNTTYACWVTPGGAFQCSAANWAGATNTDNVQINVNSGIPTVTDSIPGSVCGTGTVVLGATASSGTIDWYSASTGGTYLGSGTSFTTPSISTTTIFYAEANNGCATSASRTAVTATIRTIPTIAGTTSGSNCGTGTVTLGATASAGTIHWYSTSTGGSSLGTGTSFTTPSISSTTIYYVDATDNGCTTTSRTAINAIIDGLPTKDTTFSSTGTSTFTVPAGITTVTLELWGGGGGGDSSAKNGFSAGGGGGGGAYTKIDAYSVTSSTSYSVTVGTGGAEATAGGQSWFDNSSSAYAYGGSPGNNEFGGVGGVVATVGDTKWAGGAGASSSGGKNDGGGGGGAAGSSAGVGNSGGPNTVATGGAGGLGANDSGSGGDGGDDLADGVTGGVPGGGGGGAGGDANAGAGGAGQVKITWTRAFIDPVVPGITASPNPGCAGDNISLTITGDLNDATQWVIYTGSCGGTQLGTTSSSTFTLYNVLSTTTYYVRGEHDCVTPGSCGSLTVTVNPLPIIGSFN
jgi:hypothetical protein